MNLMVAFRTSGGRKGKRFLWKKKKRHLEWDLEETEIRLDRMELEELPVSRKQKIPRRNQL